MNCVTFKFFLLSSYIFNKVGIMMLVKKNFVIKYKFSIILKSFKFMGFVTKNIFIVYFYLFLTPFNGNIQIVAHKKPFLDIEVFFIFSLILITWKINLDHTENRTNVLEILKFIHFLSFKPLISIAFRCKMY